MITLGSNIIGLSAKRRLDESTSANTKVAERLSTGMRINKASDDAAGLTIAASLSADSRILSQSLRNINDGISLLQIGEGALKELSNIVMRQKELAEQSANGTNSYKQRVAMHNEATALTSEFNRIISTTKFNDQSVLSQTGTLSIAAGTTGTNTLDISQNSELALSVGTGTFSASGTTYTANANADVTLADLNGDGRLDIITAPRLSSGLSVLLNNGDGTFAAATTYTAGNPAAGVTATVVTGDFNGDNALDIAVTDSQDGTVSVLLNNGSGTFGVKTSYAAAPTPQGLTTADFNGDGILDLADGGTGEVRVLLGNGNGTFRVGATITGGSGNHSLESGDFNNDGKADLLFTGSTTDIYLGTGSGTFTLLSSTANSGDWGAKVADFNLDGNLDFAAATYAGGVGTTFTTYLGNGNGTFKAGAAYTTVSSPLALDIADLNGDGYMDVVVGGNTSSSTGVHLNNKDGTFGTGTSFSTGFAQYGIAAGDLNGDGVAEIVGGAAFANNIAVFSQSSTKSSNEAYFSLYTRSDARSALVLLENTLQRINREIGKVGANQKRFETAVSNLAVMNENYKIAAARIMDADIAQSTSEYIRTQILQEAGSAILKQANQTPRLILDLLRN